MKDENVFIDNNYRLNPILRELPEPVIRNLLLHEIMQYETKDRNEYLFFQDDAVDDNSKIYFLLSGEVRVVAKDRGITKDFKVDVGDAVVGEMALLTRNLRSASCAVERKATFYTMRRNFFQKIFYSAQDVAFYIRAIMLKILLAKFNETSFREQIAQDNFDHFLSKEKKLEEINHAMREAGNNPQEFEVLKETFKKGITTLIHDIQSITL